VRHVGDGTIALEYARPWEHGGVATQFELRVHAT